MFHPPSLGGREPDAQHIVQAVAAARRHLKDGNSTYNACALAAAILRQEHGLNVEPETVSNWLMDDLSRSSRSRTPNWID